MRDVTASVRWSMGLIVYPGCLPEYVTSAVLVLSRLSPPGVFQYVIGRWTFARRFMALVPNGTYTMILARLV
jgi:hypothetical protein